MAAEIVFGGVVLANLLALAAFILAVIRHRGEESGVPEDIDEDLVVTITAADIEADDFAMWEQEFRRLRRFAERLKVTR